MQSDLGISKGRLYRLLRRFRLPPFMSSTDLEAFIAASVGPMNVYFFCDAVQQCGLAITNGQRQRALSGLQKRRAICDFIVSEACLHPVQRILGAIRGTKEKSRMPWPAPYSLTA